MFFSMDRLLSATHALPRQWHGWLRLLFQIVQHRERPFQVASIANSTNFTFQPVNPKAATSCLQRCRFLALFFVDRNAYRVVGIVCVTCIGDIGRVLYGPRLHDVHINHNVELGCTAHAWNGAGDRSSQSTRCGSGACSNRGRIQGDGIEPQATRHGVGELHVRSQDVLGILHLPCVSIRSARRQSPSDCRASVLSRSSDLDISCWCRRCWWRERKSTECIHRLTQVIQPRKCCAKGSRIRVDGSDDVNRRGGQRSNRSQRASDRENPVTSCRAASLRRLSKDDERSVRYSLSKCRNHITDADCVRRVVGYFYAKGQVCRQELQSWNCWSSHADRDFARSCRRGNQIGRGGFHPITAGICSMHGKAVIGAINKARNDSGGIRRQK